MARRALVKRRSLEREDWLRERLVHAIPVHTSGGASHLSMELPQQSFRGLYNLIVLLLGVNLTRLAAENVRKYGVLVPAPWRYLTRTDLACALQVLLLIAGNIVFSYALRSASWLGYGANVLFGLGLPMWVLWRAAAASNPLVGMLLLTSALVFFLKAVSFLAVANELQGLPGADVLRVYQDDGDDRGGADAAEVCSLASFLYFLRAPTLCYQPRYPRQPQGVRKLYVAKSALRLASCVAAMYVVVHQFIAPTLRNSVGPLAQRNWLRIAERVVRLSVSSLGVWLLGFYAIFHCWLNIVGELCCFGDRGFYRDWWNAGSIGEYWRLWNAPVHAWLKRHVFRPLRARGCPAWVASLLVFLLSAVAHEVIFSVPLRAVHFWAFGAMLVQLPMVLMTRWLAPNAALGNMLFWIIFCMIGQPVGLLLYYWSWYERFVLAAQ